MKQNYIHNILFLFCAVGISSCSTEKMETPAVQYDMTLSTSIASMYEPWTKAKLINVADSIPDKKLTLYGWEGGVAWINGEVAELKSGKWVLPNSHKLDQLKEYNFLAYANMPEEGASVDATTVTDEISFNVTDITKAQNDVLLGRKEAAKPTDQNVQINLSHPFASVKFKLGNAAEVDVVKTLILSGVYSKGSTELNNETPTDSGGGMQYSWDVSGAEYVSLEANGLNAEEADSITTFVVIPQTLTPEHPAVMTIVYGADNRTMTKTIKEGEWKSGYTTVYTLDKIVSVGAEINDNRTVTNNGKSKIYVRATVTGAWYIGDDVVAPWNASDLTMGTEWEENVDMFYYPDPLAEGSSTTALFAGYSKPAAPVAGATLKIDILVQAIPYNVNKSCQEAFEALNE